jgi:redox-sensitive bicupin YhaK (pirin superfamily)
VNSMARRATDSASDPAWPAPPGARSEAVIRRSGQRGRTRNHWLEAWHSFNFGSFQEPGNRSFGLLIVFNDDIIQPGQGFGPHPHRDLEIITWPVAGRVHHRDSVGNEGELGPGMLQQMTAGRGIVHSEVNPSRTQVARWVQMWVVPDRRGLTPSYQDLDLDASGALAEGDLVPLVGRRHPDALAEHHQQDAVFWAGRLPAGRKVLLPRAPMLHCYVTTGAAEVKGVGILREGDAARLTTGGGEQLIAAADESAEVLVWEMHATVADQWPSTGGH